MSDNWIKLKNIISQYFHGNQKDIALDSHLINDLSLDSISIMSIILNAEKIFNIEVSGQDFKDYMINTPNDILAVIEKNIIEVKQNHS